MLSEPIIYRELFSLVKYTDERTKKPIELLRGENYIRK
jgi:hypothetical protein